MRGWSPSEASGRSRDSVSGPTIDWRNHTSGKRNHSDRQRRYPYPGDPTQVLAKPTLQLRRPTRGRHHDAPLEGPPAPPGSRRRRDHDRSGGSRSCMAPRLPHRQRLRERDSPSASTECDGSGRPSRGAQPESLPVLLARYARPGHRATTHPAVQGGSRCTPLAVCRRSWVYARFELEVEAADTAQDVGRHVVVAAGAGRAVLLLGDPDVVHPVEQALDGDATLGARERRTGARVRAVTEREVLARVGALDLEVGRDARSGRDRGSRRR